MAEYVSENFDFDKILFIPAACPPHKEYDNKLSNHRLEMVKIAIKNNKKFDVSDIEFLLPKPSYTYNTVLEIYKMYDISDKIGFIIGEDAFLNILTWYKTDKLKELVNFIVFKRSNDFKNNKFNFLKGLGYNYQIANWNFVDESSTNIRYIIKNRFNDYYKKIMLDKEVEKYIEKYDLYKN